MRFIQDGTARQLSAWYRRLFIHEPITRFWAIAVGAFVSEETGAAEMAAKVNMAAHTTRMA